MTLKEDKTRLNYLDNLKVFLIILVIIHHAGQAYGPTGFSWFYISKLHEKVFWLKRFFIVNASFFMGLFFMISGYFFPTSFDRHGARKFLQEKLRRFGIPILFAFLVMMPAVSYFYYYNFSGNQPIGYANYFTHIFLGIGGKPAGYIETFGFPEWNIGPLWFVEHLLIYSILYALVRIVFKNFKIQERSSAPGFFLIISMGLLIGIFSSIIRLWYPIDKWIRFLGFIQMEPAHLPQYLILLITGIMANREKWFQKISRKTGFTSLAIGIVMAGIIYFEPFSSLTLMIHIHDYPFYEAFMGVFIVWGLIVSFREFFNQAGALMRWLAKNSYAAYIFHLPIVIAFQYLIDKILLNSALENFIIVSILSVVSIYLFSSLVRQVPYVKRIL